MSPAAFFFFASLVYTVHTPGAREPGAREPGDEVGQAVRCAKVITMDGTDRVFAPGVVLMRDGLIEAVGGDELEIPEGYELHEFDQGWAAPGMVDLHSHIQSRGDTNDMVYPVNPGLRTTPALRPGNRRVRVACAGGVTTLFGIPGSGTSLSGFGVLYKTKLDDSFADSVLESPGGLKVAQDSNPERRVGRDDFGNCRASLSWILEDLNEKTLAALREDRFVWFLEDLKKVHQRQLPVLIHTAGSDGVINTARMWRVQYPTDSVLSHGSFDGWKSARYVGEVGMPVNNGPRTMDYSSSREGRIVGLAHEYHEAGVPLISLNTDAGVMPQEELFLQGAMASRFGADPYLMMRAVTIHPAIAFGIDDRVGSIEPGKHADLVVRTGDPLDPRSRVESVWIEGQIEYDRKRDGQVF